MPTITGEEILTRIIAGRPLNKSEAEQLARWLIVNKDDCGQAAGVLGSWLEGQGIRAKVEDVKYSDLWGMKDVEGPLADEGDFTGHDNPGFAASLTRRQRRQARRFIEDLLAIAQVKLGVINILLSEDRLEEWRDEIAATADGELREIMSREGGRAIRRAVSFASTPPAVEVTFDLQNRRALEFLSNESRVIGRSMTDAFSDKLRETLVEGVRAGESTDVIAKRITEVSDVFTPFKAKRIARTETAFAFIESNIQGWEQSGVVVGKQFVCAPDCCPFCQAAQDRWPQERTLQLRQPMFPVGGQLSAEFVKADGTTVVRRLTFDYEGLNQSGGVMGPPIHPNCRCDLQPIIAEEFA